MLLASTGAVLWIRLCTSAQLRGRTAKLRGRTAKLRGRTARWRGLLRGLLCGVELIDCSASFIGE